MLFDKLRVTMRILCMDIPEEELADDELAYLSQFQGKDINLTEMWKLMDQAWKNAGASYAEADMDAVSKFYALPVWLLNGIFSECDAESKYIRERIADWLAERSFNTVIDYGGGYGALARKIASLCPDTQVNVVDPFPRRFAQVLSKKYKNLAFIPTMSQNADCIIAQDVLEHVVDPLNVFAQLLENVKTGGYVITANCFYPVIDCHLPQTFHFRYTFRHIVPSLGCRYVGAVTGVRYAQVFQKIEAKPDWHRARWKEHLSKKFSPILNFVVEPGKNLVRPLWKMLRRMNRT